MQFESDENKKNDSALLPDKPRRPEAFNVLTSPYWVGVFILLVIPIFLLASQVESYILKFIDLRQFSTEQKYSIYALFAGVGADIFLRRWLKVVLVVWRFPPIPFLFMWIAAAVGIFMFEPLDL